MTLPSPQSLLDLECQNPELREASGGVEGGSLRLLIDFCIFSDITINAAVHSNNQVRKIPTSTDIAYCLAYTKLKTLKTAVNACHCDLPPAGRGRVE